MSVSRANAPLVELIAELRWEPAPETRMQVSGGAAGPTLITANNGELDAFFMRFGGHAHTLGHTEQERVVPPGFPMMAHQAVHRFKRVEDGLVRTVLQVGPGLFSANAVPPYESWSKKFELVVRQGVEAALQSRGANESSQPLTGVSLRYIDAFSEYHTEGRDVGRFLREILKIEVNVPEAITQHVRSDGMVKPMVQFQIPMEDGLIMGMSIGEGVVNNSPAIVMDTSVSTTQPIPATVDAAMEAFSIAHEAISATFEALVKPIAHLMPIKADSEQ